MKTVFYKNDIGLNIAANMFFPENFDESKEYPAIVVGHPAGGVKEQTAGLYASRLAKHGFVTIAFDATYQGESEGEPRHTEDPDRRVEDFRTTIDYLTTLPYIDNERIGVLGICASGGYSFKATATDHRVKALATISGADIGLTFRRGWIGDQDLETTTFPLLDQIAQVRTAEANGEKITYANWVANELTDDMTEEAKQGHLYYRTPRAGHPRSTNEVPLVNFDRILGFSAFNLTDLITQPVLFIAGSEALTLWESTETFDKLNRDDKELFIVEGANHFDMYDQEPYVTQSEEKMADFFGKYL